MRKTMQILSDCAIGALLVSADDQILAANAAAAELMHAKKPLVGCTLSQTAPFLLDRPEAPPYANPAFNRYLIPCPAPKIDDLPPDLRLLTFRDGTCEVRHNILMQALDHLPIAVTVWDSDCRFLMLNKASERIESHLSEHVLGEYGMDLYKTQGSGFIASPVALKQKKPVLDLRQSLVNEQGKRMELLSNAYPVIENGHAVAAICLSEDMTTLVSMSAFSSLSSNITEQRVVELQNSHGEVRSALTARFHFEDIIYSSLKMYKLIEKCRLVALSDSPVMIYGETGTGKELFAQSIHNASRRRTHPFVAINCAAIPETLLESILFGTEKGAYTGAVQREGLFELAHQGTLLLDELNSMNIMLQAKLLRVLQEGTVRRIGGLRDIPVDVRVISNLNMPPLDAVQQGLLRQDLFYRLGVINLTIPPLRERGDDIPVLAQHFLVQLARKLGKKATVLQHNTLRMLCDYEWPGNVRELQHAIEHALNLLPADQTHLPNEVFPEHILQAVRKSHKKISEQTPTEEAQPTVKSVMDEAARQLITKTLQKTNGNVSHAAKTLKMSRQNLQHYMNHLGIKNSGR